MTHPHRDLIIALLDDPTLEVEQFFYLCEPVKADINLILSDKWGTHKFRIKEKPKPDVVRYGRARIEWLDMNQDAYNNVKFTFSADGTLKNAEVI